MPAIVTISCIPAKHKMFTIWPFLERGGEPSDACEGIVMGSDPYLTSPPPSVLLSASAATSLVQVTTIPYLTNYNGLLIGLPEMALDLSRPLSTKQQSDFFEI